MRGKSRICELTIPLCTTTGFAFFWSATAVSKAKKGENVDVYRPAKCEALLRAEAERESSELAPSKFSKAQLKAALT